MKCCTQAKLALFFGGTPNFHRTSSCNNSPFQSESLNGGLASKKSAFKSLNWSSWNESPHLILASIPLMAIFILQSLQVVWLLSCPKTEISPILPPCASINFSLCTTIPPLPQQGSKILPL